MPRRNNRLPEPLPMSLDSRETWDFLGDRPVWRVVVTCKVPDGPHAGELVL